MWIITFKIAAYTNIKCLIVASDKITFSSVDAKVTFNMLEISKLSECFPLFERVWLLRIIYSFITIFLELVPSGKFIYHQFDNNRDRYLAFLPFFEQAQS